VRLPSDIDVDAVDRVGELRRLGEAFAATVDWPAILAGADREFLVTGASTLSREYSRVVPLG